jgi:hypothetical protein
MDVQKPLAFGYDGYFVKRVPFAAGLAALGFLVFFLVEGEGSRDREAMFAASILIAAGLGFIAYAYYRRAHPHHPVLRLTSSGVRYRIPGVKEVFIPWRDVQSVESIDYPGFNWLGPVRIRFRDITAIVVSKRFYDSQIHVGSLFWRGPGWEYLFVPKSDAVQITLHHDLMGLQADELRSAVECRWRAFSDHPNAKLPTAPRTPRAPGLLPDWARSRAAKGGALIALFLLVLPALYFWQWGMAWKSFSLSEGSRQAYLGQMLDHAGVASRLEDGRVVRLRRDEIVDAAVPDCEREIVRDPAGTTFTPAYTASATCTALLKHVSGTHAMAIFKLVVVDASWEDYSGKRQPGSAIATKQMTLAEADAALCARGYCGSGGGVEIGVK